MGTDQQIQSDRSNLLHLGHMLLPSRSSCWQAPLAPVAGRRAASLSLSFSVAMSCPCSWKSCGDHWRDHLISWTIRKGGRDKGALQACDLAVWSPSVGRGLFVPMPFASSPARVMAGGSISPGLVATNPVVFCSHQNPPFFTAFLVAFDGGVSGVWYLNT